MAFENETNAGRVQKMIELFGHIQKSAESNNADTVALRAMMLPLLDVLGANGLSDALGEGSAPQGANMPPLTAGERAALHLADKSSLRDLIAALLGRLEAHDARLAAQDTT
ncbi:hypothetical protein [Phaeobacter piscinae]|uniref:hypothetical protein n=1 Tax=Phaeobacter piscinae TaxID=1580596 RepID=UPI00058FDB69|nr:hypothetical protein [Phaeobacter piscinae]UTS82728.1 hypothetical protein OL67_003838 [Phaeobacter piscinae]